jgi:hypothetical protein
MNKVNVETIEITKVRNFKYYTLIRIHRLTGKKELLFGSYIKDQCKEELDVYADHDTPKKDLKIETGLTTETPSKNVYTKEEIKQIYK